MIRCWLKLVVTPILREEGCGKVQIKTLFLINQMNDAVDWNITSFSQVWLLNKHAFKTSVKSKDAFSVCVTQLGARLKLLSIMLVYHWPNISTVILSTAWDVDVPSGCKKCNDVECYSHFFGYIVMLRTTNTILFPRIPYAYY